MSIRPGYHGGIKSRASAAVPSQVLRGVRKNGGAPEVFLETTWRSWLEKVREKWRSPRSVAFVHVQERSPSTTRTYGGNRQEIHGSGSLDYHVCVGLRKSQVKTLAELVAAALRMPRASLAELGRRLAASTCKTAKHCIQRAWRFTSNERIPIPDAMQGTLRWLFRQRQPLSATIRQLHLYARGRSAGSSASVGAGRSIHWW
jgi:hypothetical protein